MGEFGPWHLLIVAAVFVMLFGAKRLPDAARSLGRSARILKTEIKSMNDDDPSEHVVVAGPDAVTEPPAPAPAPAVVVPESVRTS